MQSAYKHTDILEKLINDKYEDKLSQRKSTVMVSIDQSGTSVVDIRNMLEAGMNIAMIRMTATSKWEKMHTLAKLDHAARVCCAKYGLQDWPVASCIELKSTVVKTGMIEKNKEFVTIVKGAKIKMTNNADYYNKCSDKIIFVDLPNLCANTAIGYDFSLEFEEIKLKCIAINDTETITCSVIKGGLLRDKYTVTVSGDVKTQALLSEQEKDLVLFALAQQVDIIVISVVHRLLTIKMVKDIVKKYPTTPPLILCGVCTYGAIDHFDEILKESDGIIFSRSCLPFRTKQSCSSSSQWINIQKWMAAKCTKAGKPFLVSGGIFIRTINEDEYRDSEVAEITNMILDGVTGFALKEHADPVRVVRAIEVLNDLCRVVEVISPMDYSFPRLSCEMKIPVNAAEACALSAVIAANQCEAKIIVVPTATGRTAKALFWMRPRSLIIAVSPKTSVIRLMLLYRGVLPLKYAAKTLGDFELETQNRIHYAVKYAVTRKWLQFDEYYVTLQKFSHSSSFCDSVVVHQTKLTFKPKVGCEDDCAFTPGNNKSINMKKMHPEPSSTSDIVE